MAPRMPTRLVVIGNSGSGKSRLATRLGAAAGLPVYGLDALHWRAVGVKRDEAEASALVADAASGERWIIEGVYGWLAGVALERAHAVVWLDPPWRVCLDGLRRRGSQHGETPADGEALIDWASAYWTRRTSSSFAGHAQLYDAFAGPKIRLRTREAASAFALSGLAGDDGGRRRS